MGTAAGLRRSWHPRGDGGDGRASPYHRTPHKKRGFPAESELQSSVGLARGPGLPAVPAAWNQLPELGCLRMAGLGALGRGCLQQP